MTQCKRGKCFWLQTGILFINFFLKLFSFFLDPVISRDGSSYIRFSQIWFDTGSFQLASNEFRGVHLPPLPLYLIKSLMHLFGLPAEVFGVSLNLILGTFTPLIAYKIAYEVTHTKNIALGSAFLLAVNPSMNAFAHEVQRDMIYLFFIGLLLWLIIAGIRRQKGEYWLFGGIACSCAILTRFETLEFLGLVPLVLFLQCIRKYCSWKKGFCYAGLFFLSLFGSILFLSFLMQTQEYLFPNYENFFQSKIKKIMVE